MTRLLFILFLLIAEEASTQELPPQRFSNMYEQYSKKYKELVVYSGTGYGSPVKARVFARKRRNWRVFDHYTSKIYLEDSVVKRDKIRCRYMDSFLLANKILDLKDEQAVEPCIERMDSMQRAQSGQPGRNLNNIYDIGFFGLEYKWKRTERKIWYRDPWEALKICPYSKDREAFRLSIMAFQNLNPD